jgi:hypothetical protein
VNCVAGAPGGDYLSRAIVDCRGAPTADTAFMGLTSCRGITIAGTIAHRRGDAQPTKRRATGSPLAHSSASPRPAAAAAKPAARLPKTLSAACDTAPVSARATDSQRYVDHVV